MKEYLCQSDIQLEDNERWMSNLPEKLWDCPLYNLSIPGSHDTMSYCLDKTSPFSPEVPKILLTLAKYVPYIVRSLIYNWSTTQCLSVREQLDAGIRYLDLRIALRPDDPSFNLYFVHGFYTSVTVEKILQEILDWLKTHPTEVLILSCRDLDAVSPDLHAHFTSVIHRILDPKLCPRNECPTLRNMWKQGYQVIISDDNTLALKDNYLWPSIPYWWANTTRTSTLIHFLEKKKQNGRPAGFFTAGLNLTENAFYILSHPLGSMRKMTIPKLPLLYKWVQRQHPGKQKDAINIIAEDLIGLDGFVSAVINLNRKLRQEDASY
ncbi:PI-PLC X domain-containing protein 1 [Spea bombifrons]|uniref:PI-PLC X domain-containing protein 1 n=1 Tax=Spea bombifrons TaxID=233779 RepID=UPI002349EA41|nr:PI-PLC X domain-containing protein 1 [Spea bombifrons]XP_053313487.1 PI-PLC X domain-containing protein 1 [Spea bombifrons]